MSKPLLLFLVTEDWAFLNFRLPMANAARAVGFNVAVACRVQHKQAEIEQLGFKVYPLKWQRSGNTFLMHFQALWQIFLLYRRLKPHVIHHVAMKPILFGMVAGFFSRAFIVNSFTGLGFAFSRDTLKARCLKMAIHLVLKILFLRPRVHHVFQNEDDQQVLHCYRHASLIVGSGVDCDYFYPNRTGDKTPCVMMISRALKDKGVVEFFEAVKILKARGVLARFVLVGEPDLDNPNAITQAAWANFCATGEVECWGYRSDVRECWWQCDLAVLPSYREGLPKSLLEAAACGKAILTTDAPGCRVMVIPHQNGLLVPIQNSVALADAMAELLADPARLVLMGQVSRERAVKEWSASVVAQQITAVYLMANA